MRFAICDDNFRFLRSFQARVGDYCRRHNIPCQCRLFLTPSELLLASIENFDMVFLNVDMGCWDGVGVARTIRQQGSNTLILFVSDYVQFAPQGYGVGAFRYLLKNELDENFDAAMQDALAALSAPCETIAVQVSRDTFALPLDKILYIESNKRVATFYMTEHLPAQLSCYKKLSELETELAGKGFLRIHKSFLANMQYITEICNYTTLLSNGVTLQTSRQNYRLTKETFCLWKAAAVQK